MNVEWLIVDLFFWFYYSQQHRHIRLVWFRYFKTISFNFIRKKLSCKTFWYSSSCFILSFHLNLIKNIWLIMNLSSVNMWARILYCKVPLIQQLLQSHSEGIYLPCLWYLPLYKNPIIKHFISLLSNLWIQDYSG